jgi:hypothetical protein
MMLRELSKEEIKSLSSRWGVKGKAVQNFMTEIGGISMSAAYEKLNHERKLNIWNLQTVSAISDGIILATTKSWDKHKQACSR